MRGILTLAIPSKGRLMEATAELLARSGFTIDRMGAERGYRGRLVGLDGVEIAFLSASEIAQNLRDGKVDLGVTGQDLLHEKVAPDDTSVQILLKLGFGPRTSSSPCPNAGWTSPPWPTWTRSPRASTSATAAA